MDLYLRLRPLARGVTLAYWLALMVGTHLPATTVSVGTSDKTLHIVAFAGLAFLLAWSFGGPHASRMRLFALFSLVILYGAADEVSQGFTATRHPEVQDWLADFAGAILGSMAYVPVRLFWNHLAKTASTKS